MSKSKPVFTVDTFTTTANFATAADKAAFANHFVRFVLGGFPQQLFTKDFYQKLSNIFGHIAHYDQGGFWGVWFETPAKQQMFICRCLEWTPMGQPDACWVDVERVLQSWVNVHGQEIAEILVENQKRYSAGIMTETARREALKGKAFQKFKVMAKTSRTGGFGHWGFILAAEDHSAYRVNKIFHFTTGGRVWEIGDTVDVPLRQVIPDIGEPDWAKMGCEACERAPDYPGNPFDETIKPPRRKKIKAP